MTKPREVQSESHLDGQMHLKGYVADRISMTEKESRQRDLLIARSALLSTQIYPSIRNPHFEHPISIFLPFPDAVQRIGKAIGRAHKSFTNIVDFYFDTKDKQLEREGIYARVRFYGDDAGMVRSVRTIFTLQPDKAGEPFFLEDIPFKPEIVYLNRVDRDGQKGWQPINDILKLTSESLTEMRLTKLIRKTRAEYEIVPWAHVPSQLGGQTMSDEWVNCYVDNVEIYNVTGDTSLPDILKNMQDHDIATLFTLADDRMRFQLQASSVIGEMETSRAPHAIATCIELVKKIRASKVPHEFRTRRKIQEFAGSNTLFAN